MSTATLSTAQETTLETPSIMHLYREFFATRYIQGQGIEIGALHSPLKVPAGVKVRYVDRMTVPELKRQYRELASANLVQVDIVADGELLETVADGSQDFVIASHFIEHCQDPIRAIGNMLRVLKPAGIVYMIVPDKRHSFDLDRPVTTFAHLLRDYQEGPKWSKYQHFQEWVECVDHITDPEEVTHRVKRLLDLDYSIHFHVWTAIDFLDFLICLKHFLNFSFEIETVFENGPELITVFRKIC